MRFHRIGAATAIVAALAAPATAQTDAPAPDAGEPATHTDHDIRARLGLPDPARGARLSAVFAPVAPARPSATRGSSSAGSALSRPQAEPPSWPWGWTLRGFIGGLVAGPIGTAVAFRMAGNSDVAAPAATASGTAVPQIDPAYVESIRSRRKEASFVGGMVGTAAFLYATLVVLDIDGSGDASAGGDPREPDPGF